MAAGNEQQDSIAGAITQVSDSLGKLVHDEIELAKAEVGEKISSIARGTAAVAAGAVFGVFAVILALLTIAWALDAILVSGVGDVWIGFLIVTGVLVVLALLSFLFAWRKLRVGAPTPTMAIDEAKKIRETVSTSAAKS
ncbi:phage holin family protein [Conexibacter sp. S30A1]|uniref:phage holin family protein n=1 Tax=Conexibacter sp. S30A1 TaxID=2937800 RepID=UPI0020101075|nr:phage holin family protein [Conexibacter sp. S30A1]